MNWKYTICLESFRNNEHCRQVLLLHPNVSCFSQIIPIIFTLSNSTLLSFTLWISFIFELRYTYCFITEFDVDFVLSAVYSIYVKQHKNNKNYQVSFYLLKAHWDKYFTHISSSQQSCKLSFIIFILYIRKLWLREVK